MYTSYCTPDVHFVSVRVVIRDMYNLSFCIQSRMLEMYDNCLFLFYSYLFRLDTLQQLKARLELSNQTLKQQHQKELEGREEEVEQVRTAMNKKLKALSQQLEDMHEEKQAAVKVGPTQMV